MVAPSKTEPTIEDVTPVEASPPAAPNTEAVAVHDAALTPEWRPEPGAVFARDDHSLRAILGRSFQNDERGLAPYDPITKRHVWWKPNGRGGHSPVIRSVAEDLTDARETGADYFDFARNCWVWGGTKAAADAASFRTDTALE
jgi:hypothetical protein